MAQGCDYEKQLKETGRLVAEELGHKRWRLVYQSRSGPASQPWLEPDILDYLRELAPQRGGSDVVIAPIGFVSDHVEIVFDLDKQARELCTDLGLHMVRAETVGTHPRFISMICELIRERMNEGQTRRALGMLGPRSDFCALDCCLAVKRPASE
jgi:ferrochelatase